MALKLFKRQHESLPGQDVTGQPGQCFRHLPLRIERFDMTQTYVCCPPVLAADAGVLSRTGKLSRDIFALRLPAGDKKGNRVAQQKMNAIAIHASLMPAGDCNLFCEARQKMRGQHDVCAGVQIVLTGARGLSDMDKLGKEELNSGIKRQVAEKMLEVYRVRCG